MSENTQQCPNCGEYVPIEYVTCVWCAYDLTAEHLRRADITISYRDSVQRAIGVIRNPLRTLKEISLVPDQKGPRLSLLLSGLLISIHLSIIIFKLGNFGYTTVSQEGTTFFQGVLQFFLSLVPTIVLWGLGTVFFFLIFNVIWRLASRIIRLFSSLLGGGSEKTKMRAIIGYSTVPLTLMWGVTILFRLFSASPSLPDSPSYADISSAVTAITSTGIGPFISFLLIISWIWAMVLGVIGVSYAAKITYLESAIAAGIPYLLFILVIIGG